ncbi:MAG: hypothetical protein HT580_10585 [Dechloromonas sp.]|nr:MAG: hypothetical protein HT580_10585 [Dechloromonas sp.]
MTPLDLSNLNRSRTFSSSYFVTLIEIKVPKKHDRKRLSGESILDINQATAITTGTARQPTRNKQLSESIVPDLLEWQQRPEAV